MTLSKRARTIEEKADAKKKQEALNKINHLISRKSEETHAERKAEH